jgi:thiol:disulfide interchange protein DsbA
MTRNSLLALALLSAALCAACGESQNAGPSSAATTAATPAEDTAATGQLESQSVVPADEKTGLTAAEDTLETTGERAGSSVSALPIRMAAAATPATSARFQAGKNYKTLVPAQPTDVAPDEVEVLEVFWYGCGHCYALDPLMENWRAKGKPGYVDFSRLPAMWNDNLRIHARMYYTAEILGKIDELHPVMFRAIHVDGNPLNTEQRIRDFFAKHGVAAADFDKAFSGFAVDAKLKRADFLNRRYRVTGVPMMVVNGKYTADVGSAGSPEDLLELVAELAAHEHSPG